MKSIRVCRDIQKMISVVIFIKLKICSGFLQIFGEMLRYSCTFLVQEVLSREEGSGEWVFLDAIYFFLQITLKGIRIGRKLSHSLIPLNYIWIQL